MNVQEIGRISEGKSGAGAHKIFAPANSAKPPVFEENQP
jgi:hypothetical protein